MQVPYSDDAAAKAAWFVKQAVPAVKRSSGEAKAKPPAKSKPGGEPAVTDAEWSARDAEAVGAAVAELRQQRRSWSAAAWPQKFEGREACAAAFQSRAVFHTCAVCPGLQQPSGMSTGPVGPDLILHTWGENKASLAGFPDEPVPGLGGDSTKCDLLLQEPTCTLHPHRGGVFSSDGKFGNKVLDNADRLYDGVRGASVRAVAPGQKFDVRDVTRGYEGSRPRKSVVTQKGDLELTLYLSAHSGGEAYGIVYVMRRRAEGMASKKEVARRFEGLGRQWLKSGAFGTFLSGYGTK